MSDLHDRIAKTLGWSTRDVQSLSMQSLRDLVRPVDPDLAREMDYVIIRELEGYEKRIAAFKDRESKTEQHRVRKLIDKLYQVRWSP